MNPGYHETRFGFDQRREVLWATLCECYFQKLVSPDACVLDIGAGYGHFINNIRARRRIALDSWPGMLGFLKAGVEGILSPATDLAAIQDGTVDFAFASNVFEHLTRKELATTLDQIRGKLKAAGALTILQPNYRFAYKEHILRRLYACIDPFRSEHVRFIGGERFSDRAMPPEVLTTDHQVVVPGLAASDPYLFAPSGEAFWKTDADQGQTLDSPR